MFLSPYNVGDRHRATPYHSGEHRAQVHAEHRERHKNIFKGQRIWVETNLQCPIHLQLVGNDPSLEREAVTSDCNEIAEGEYFAKKRGLTHSFGSVKSRQYSTSPV